MEAIKMPSEPEQYSGKSCVGCRLFSSPRCPHAMYIHELDIAKHHCSRFKEIKRNGSGLKLPLRVFG